ncbi:uncharacterized protein ehbp1l1a isoform X2 [Archocentrus centrarchus]|uniref:uncharacterized protein ehbp1l1a isoform X2 n=1 Tax=Archocentrus centrarchus TaxID=63155 RepID=UPI0011EA3441|nr:uncharacterized protein LOC115775717 isoform X2 [Archocentrus centrarchus]
MASVWKRLQRVGKKASKFQFAASFQELVIECTNKWQPDKVRVVWLRRSRRHSTKLHSWQPGIKNPYRGLVVWQVPESLDITVTLFKEPAAEEFEDKDWTFVIESETKGCKKVLASADINMRKYASATPAQFDLTLKLKPLSVKVVEATLKLNLSCIFLKEGKATDEDMQSLASLMSVKQSDIGNLDDFNDSDDEAGEERRAIFGTGQATYAPASSTARVHDLAWRPAIELGPTVTSETDWKRSSGISATISTPSYPPPPEPPDLSVPSLILRTHTQPLSSTQQARHSLYAYSLPAFTHAHPPVLPKIFQPSPGSAPQRPQSFHSDSSPAEGSEAQTFSTFIPSRTLSTSSLPRLPSESSKTACPSVRRRPPIPSFSSVSSSTAPLSSFPPMPPSHSAAKAYRTSDMGSVHIRPTSLPFSPETAPWQTEWRPPKSQVPLAQPAYSPTSVRHSVRDPGQAAVLQKKQRIEMPSSSSLLAAQPLDQNSRGGSGYSSSWKPQVTSTLETSSPSPLHPSSVNVFSGLPRLPQLHMHQTPTVCTSEQDAEFRRQLSTLSEEDNQCTTTSDPRAPASQKQFRASEQKGAAAFGLVKASPGPQHISMEENNATSQQPTSNDTLTDVNKDRDVISDVVLDKPSHDQNTSPDGQQGDISVPQRVRKPIRKAQDPQQKDCDGENVPKRPLRRKDSLTPERKQHVDCVIESVKKDANAEITSTRPAADPASTSSIENGHAEVQSSHNEEHIQVTPYTGVHKHKEEETDLTQITQIQPDQTSCTLKLPEKDTKTPLQVSTHVSPLNKIESIAPKPELVHYEQPATVSIIKKIRLPQRGKKVPSSESDRGVTAQNVNVALKESVKPVQFDKTAVDVQELNQPAITCDTSVDALNIRTSQTSVDALMTAETESPKQTTHPIPRPRMKKRWSGAFPSDFSATEKASQASHGEEAQSGSHSNNSQISSAAKELSEVEHHKDLPLLSPAHQPLTSTEEVTSVQMRKSRLTSERSVRAEDGDSSCTTVKPSSFPVPKPRAKKCWIHMTSSKTTKRPLMALLSLEFQG